MKKEELFKLMNAQLPSKWLCPTSPETLEMLELIRECFTKEDKVPPKSLENFEMSLDEVDLCLYTVSDIFCEEGMNDNSNTLNDYGSKLEDASAFLVRIRHILADSDKSERRKKKVKHV